MSQKRAHEEYHDPDYPVASTSADRPHDASPAAKRARPSSPGIAATTSAPSTTASTTTPTDRADHIRRIVRREFAHELNEREQELNCIEHRLQQAKRLLQRVRYAVVYSFYTNKRLVYTDSELRNELTVVSMSAGAAEETIVDPSELEPSHQPSSLTAADTSDAPPPFAAFGSQQQSAATAAASQPPQNAVHPSLKKLLGTTTIDYNEILKVRPARQAAKDAKTSIAEKLRTKKDERRLRLAAAAISPMQATLRDTTTAAPEEPVVPPKVPRYVSPIKSAAPIPHVTTMRAGAMRNATRHLVAVGNTSKFIGDDSGDPGGSQAGGVTHKWLVYVKCKQPTTTNAPNVGSGGGIERMVQKVRFFLHPSYKPNDVVDVCSAPFQIARRGWGEFPVRVQLWFHAHVQQKPLQIIHQLVLDKKLTGLQTMGAETVVEMWLNLPAEAAVVVKPAAAAATVLSNGHSAPKLMGQLPKTPVKLNRVPIASAPIAAVDIPLEQTALLGTEPCWDPDGLINNVKISPAEQNSLLAMAEESKRFAAGQCMVPVPAKATTVSPAQPKPAAVSNGTTTTLVNGSGAASSKPMPQTTIVINSEPKASSTPKSAATSALVVNSEPVASKVSITLAPIATKAAAPVRKFVKCLNAAGKVVMVELQTDPNNPKNIRLIRNSAPTIAASAMANVSPAAANKPATTVAVSSAAVVPTPTVEAAPKPIAGPTNTVMARTPPSRFVVLPKTTATLPAVHHSTQAIQTPVKPSPVQISTPRPAPPIKMLPPAFAASTVQTSAPSSSSSTLPSTKKVIMRNGQMFIIDTSQFVSRPIPQICPPTATASSTTTTPTRPAVIAAAAKPKQQSLLKPQISLLKPKLTNKTQPQPSSGTVIMPPTIAAAAKNATQTVPLKFAIKLPITADGQTRRPVGLMPLVRRIVRAPSSSSSSSLMRGANPASIPFGLQRLTPVRPPLSAIVLPPEKSLFHSATSASNSTATAANSRLIIQQRHDYRRELQQRFLSRAPFATERAAIEFLLRQVPQVHRFAGTSPEYAQAFPFVCDSERSFDAFVWPKQRSTEWMRAKFIGRLLDKCRAVPNAIGGVDKSGAPSATVRWTTREIVLFARLFGYALPVRPIDGHDEGEGEKMAATDPTTAAITTLIKREIKRVERTHEPTLTTSVRITSWMDAWHARRNRRRRPAATVDEEIVDVTGNAEADGGATSAKSKRGKGSETLGDGRRSRPKAIYPLPAALRTEAGWVSDVCGQVQVKLKPEEIVEDILHPSSQLVLVTALHRFISDLLHRGYASKSETVRNSTNATDHVVGVEDLRNCIVTTAHFDFLTNRHLGGSSTTDSKTTIKQERP